MINQLNQKFSLSGHIRFTETCPGFPVMHIKNEHAKASISLYGGHLLSFQPYDQPHPVIWLSDNAIYKWGKAIRGGVPICWPWFGDNSQYPQQPAHGFARISFWEIGDINNLDNGATQIDLQMPCQSACQNYQSVAGHFNVTLNIRFIIGEQLQIILSSINRSKKKQSISNALHTYLQISHIEHVTIEGLDNVTYLDKMADNQAIIQQGELQLFQETDRIYLDTEQSIHLLDPGYKRKIVISKQNARSTVIWNPWNEKSKAMNDMPENGWSSMVCIEAANAASNTIQLEPGLEHQLAMTVAVLDWP